MSSPGEASSIAALRARPRPDRRRPAIAAGNLPEPVSSLVGRRDDVAGVARLVGGSRLVTICGPGGVGKTRVVVEAARACQGHDAERSGTADVRAVGGLDGAWMVELASIGDPDMVPHAVLSELVEVGGNGARGRPVDDLVRSLRSRRALLVLDNCEHVLDSATALVSGLLRACPRLRVLTTSRQPLGIAGERVWWLQPLAVAGDAVTLFVDRAREVNAAFALGPDTAGVVEEICRRLDGMPLAIELAATRALVLSPDEILARLRDRFELLTATAPSAGARRQRTLKATLDWSHDLLAPQEAVFLRRLSVFSGGWSLDAAERVCADERDLPERTLDLTAALVAKSLIVAQRLGTPTRYRMLQTVRAYGRERLDGAGETARLLAAHAEWCTARAEQALDGRDGRGREDWLRALEEDHDNFRAALAWARDGGHVDIALRLADALAWFWETRGHLQEGLDWLESALAASEDRTAGPSRARAGVMRSVGRFVQMLGDHGSGMAIIDRSVDLFRSLGQVDEAQSCVCHDALHVCGNPLYAAPAIEAGLDRIREMGDPRRLAHALSNLGQARFFVGDAAGARRCFGEVLDLKAAGIDGDAADEALLGLGRVGLLVGDLATAEPPLHAALANAERSGDPDGRCAALSLLGEVARLRGDTVGARTLLETALEAAKDGCPAISIGRCELFLGHVDVADGALDDARRRYAQALRRTQAGATHHYHQTRCILGLAEVAAATGKHELAAGYLDEAADAAQASGDTHAAARALSGQADLTAAAGDLDTAVHLHHQAVNLEERIGDRHAIARSLEALGALAALHAQGDKAGRLFGAAHVLRQQLGIPRPALAEARYAAARAQARRTLSPEAWDAAWEQGIGLSVQETLSYARKGRGARRRPRFGWESLTPAERDVVALVAQGLTNREVAERLFVSRRTVGNHLTRVYGKLAIHTRRELIRAPSDSDQARPAHDGCENPAGGAGDADALSVAPAAAGRQTAEREAPGATAGPPEHGQIVR